LCGPASSMIPSVLPSAKRTILLLRHEGFSSIVESWNRLIATTGGQLSILLKSKSLPPPRASWSAADVGFQLRAVEQHRIDREASTLGIGVLADGGLVVAEETLKCAAIELAFGLGEQVEHPLALWV